MEEVTTKDDKTLSFSIWVNSKPVTRHGFDGIQRCSRWRWVEDNSVNRCGKCKIDFGWTTKLGMPYMIRKHHCIVEGTPVTLSTGMAIPIENVKVGQMVPAWDETTASLDPHASVSAVLDQGISTECMEIVMETGQTLQTTTDHLVLSLDDTENVPSYRKASDLVVNKHRLVCSTLQGVVDMPTEDELEWKMEGSNFTMDQDREKALAFARLCGYVQTDGHLAPTPSRVVFCCGEECDARSVCEDIGLVTGTVPGLIETKLGTVYRVEVRDRMLWTWLTQVGVTSGSKVDKGIRLPSFMWDDDCPKSIQREYLAGWIGGDGNRPRKGNGGKSLLFDPMLQRVNASLPKQLEESRLCLQQMVDILNKQFSLHAVVEMRPLQGFIKGLYTPNSKTSSHQLGVRIENGTFIPQLDTGTQYLQLLHDDHQVDSLPSAVVINSLKRANLITSALEITPKGVVRLNTVLDWIHKATETPSLFRVTRRMGIKLSVGDIPQLHDTIGVRYCAQKQEKFAVCAAFERYRKNKGLEKRALLHCVLDVALKKHPHLEDPRQKDADFRQRVSIPPEDLTAILDNCQTDCSLCGSQTDCSLCGSFGVGGLRHLLQGTRRTYERSPGELSTVTFNDFLTRCGFDWDSPSRESTKTFSLQVVSVHGITGPRRIYDLTVPTRSSFVANGVVVHNCRYDGMIYCDSCSSRRVKIPLDIPIPEPLNGTNEGREPDEALRVCDDCFVKLYQLKRSYKPSKNWAEYTAFMDHVRDIEELKALSLVCREWNKIANYHLSRFFQLQYHLPGQLHHERDIDMLWANRQRFPGHSRWIVQLIRSVRFQTVEGLRQLPEVCRLISEHVSHSGHNRKVGHWNLMCTRNCSHSFTLEELITVLDESVSNETVRSLLVESLDRVVVNTDEDELLCYIGYLVHHMSTADCAMNESVLGQWLVKMSANSIRIANEVYWEMVIRTNATRDRDANMYRYWLEQWGEKVPVEMVNVILSGRAFAEGCLEVGAATKHTTPHHQQAHSRHRLSRQPSSLSAPESVRSYLQRTPGIISPTHPERGKATVDIDRVRVKQSITRPIAMPLTWGGVELAGGSGGGESHGKILFKAEDVRKDHIVMNFIRLANRILVRELGIDLNIVTYNIRPTGPAAGFIEMVASSTTLYEIDAEHKCDMFNYVDEEQRISQVRQRFMRSTAAYCVLTFLLGAGDRHKHNIMITKEGVLFHIDYGYVMGADPKQNPLLPKVPDMRIDRRIADALGPPEQFREFEELVDKIYNCLRRHVQELCCVMRLLVLSNPPIHIKHGFNEKRFMREVLKRFAPGEHHEQARIQIINRVHNSTQSTTHYAVVDGLHHLAQTNRVLKALSSAWHGVKRTFF